MDQSAPRLAPLHPAVRRLWWINGGVAACAVTLVVGIVTAALPLPVATAAVTIVAAVVAFGLAAVVPFLRYRRWGYLLRDDDLWLRRGVLWVTTTVVPLHRMQFVDTRQGPLDRFFGLARLVVHTAAPGTSAELPGLQEREAQRLRARLAQVEADAAGV